MTFRELLVESKIIIYHGDNFGTTKIDAKLMNNGNNQEGIGIYFSNNIDTAKSYGKDIIKIEGNLKLIPSRVDMSIINDKKIYNLLKDMHKADLEKFYYYISDYIEVYEPEDVNDKHIIEMIKYAKSEQVRNFQVDMAEKFGVEEFVKSWNKHIKIDGTYEKQNSKEIWYAIINTDIKVEKIN